MTLKTIPRDLSVMKSVVTLRSQLPTLLTIKFWFYEDDAFSGLKSGIINEEKKAHLPSTEIKLKIPLQGSLSFQLDQNKLKKILHGV